jgi:hypothetical protein
MHVIGEISESCIIKAEVMLDVLNLFVYCITFHYMVSAATSSVQDMS